MTGRLAPGTPLSQHLVWAEAITTQNRDAAILRQQVDPPPLVRMNLVRAAADYFEPAHALIGRMLVTSAYRCPALNAAIGGSPTSRHVEGLAFDVEPLDMDLVDAMTRLAKSAIPWDQLIYEAPAPGRRWLHLGAPRHGESARGMRLMMLAPGQYETWRATDPRVRLASGVI